MFQQICGNGVNKNVCKLFLLDVIVPTVMELTIDNHLRDIILQIAYAFLGYISVWDLKLSEFEKFSADTSSK